MGHRRTNHRPLRAGIGVTPNLGIPGYGTLTGIARRNSDGVLVASNQPSRPPHLLAPNPNIALTPTTPYQPSPRRPQPPHSHPLRPQSDTSGLTEANGYTIKYLMKSTRSSTNPPTKGGDTHENNPLANKSPHPLHCSSCFLPNCGMRQRRHDLLSIS